MGYNTALHRFSVGYTFVPSLIQSVMLSFIYHTYWSHHFCCHRAGTLNTCCEEGSDLPESSRLFVAVTLNDRGMRAGSCGKRTMAGEQLEGVIGIPGTLLRCPFCLLSCPRADAGDSEGFLENDLARELCECCHGHQPGGSGQGKVPLPGCSATPGLCLTRSCCSGELSSKMPFFFFLQEGNEFSHSGFFCERLDFVILSCFPSRLIRIVFLL